MRLSCSRRAAVAAGLAACAIAVPLAVRSAAQTARPLTLADLVPATTVFYAAVPDLAAARAAFSSTDLGRVASELGAFTDEIIAGLDPIIVDAKARFEHDSGLAFDQVLAALGGGFEVAVLDIEPRRGPRGMAALVRTAGREEAVRALVAKLREAPSGPAHASDPSAPPAPPFTVEVAGALLVADTPEGLAALQRGATGAAPAAGMLSSAPDFQAVRAKTLGAGVPFVHAYANVASLIQRAVREDQEAARALYQLGLRELRVLGAGIAFDRGKVGVALVAHAPVQGERRGILPIVGHGPAAAAALAKLAPADATAFLAANLDLGLTWDRAFALVEALAPREAQSARRNVEVIEKELGLSIRQDLLGVLGADWAAFSFVPEGGGAPLSVLTVSARDEARLASALRRFADRAGFETLEIPRAGRTIRYLRAPLGRLGEDPFRSRGGDARAEQRAALGVALGMLGSAYVFEGGRLYVADMPQTLEEYFARSRAGGDLSTNADFVAAMAAKSPSAGIVTYADPRPVFPAVWSSLIRVARMLEAPVRMAGIPIDTALLPRGATMARAIAPGVAEVAIDAEGLAIRSHATAPGLEISTFTTVPIVAAIAIPNLIEARKGANEASAIGALQTIATAQALYREMDKDGNGVLDYAPDLRALGRAQLIDPVLATGVKQGYRFEILDADQFTFSVRAVPLQPEKTGDRSFYIDESGVIRSAVGFEVAGPQSTPIGR